MGATGQRLLLSECNASSQVYMAARDETRAKEAIDRLNEKGCERGRGEIIWHELDFRGLVLLRNQQNVSFPGKENLISWVPP